MTSLIIGNGEVGSALGKILKRYYPVVITETRINTEHFDIIHICFPYTEDFVSEVKKYQEFYSPKYTVIHSTVPIGTSRKCNALHSPVRGRHPLANFGTTEESLIIFAKFIGGIQASEVADYFRRAGFKIILCDKQETTELGKLLDTEYYRHCIEFVKNSKELCDKFNVPFSEAYTLFNQTYNKGYEKLGNKEYIRPVLQPIKGEIGGHCVMSNKKLLEQSL